MQGVKLHCKLFNLSTLLTRVGPVQQKCLPRKMAALQNLNFGRNYSEWKKVNADFETVAQSDSTTSANEMVSNYGVAPIVTSSFFVMDSATSHSDPRRANETGPKCYEYSRLKNPTRDAVETLLSKLEGAKHSKRLSVSTNYSKDFEHVLKNLARTFSSGMAAVASVTSALNQGDHVISMNAIYNATYNILVEHRTRGVTVDYAKGFEVENILKLVNGNTKLILLESQVNPTLEVVDLAKLVKRVRELRHGKEIVIAVDNTFLTPIFQRPLELGIDVVIHSCTKYLNGHGDIIMGSVSTNSDDILKKVQAYQAKFGSIPSPFDCYLLTRSLRTLPLRMQQHSKNGFKVATFLENHPLVERVMYTGLESHPHHQIAKKQQFGDAGMVGFYIKGDMAVAAKFLESTKIFKRAPSLGTFCSLASLPAKLSHYSLPQEHRDEVGITNNFIRLSVGLESADALKEDLDQALRKATASRN